MRSCAVLAVSNPGYERYDTAAVRHLNQTSLACASAVLSPSMMMETQIVVYTSGEDGLNLWCHIDEFGMGR